MGRLIAETRRATREKYCIANLPIRYTRALLRKLCFVPCGFPLICPTIVPHKQVVKLLGRLVLREGEGSTAVQEELLAVAARDGLHESVFPHLLAALQVGVFVRGACHTECCIHLMWGCENIRAIQYDKCMAIPSMQFM